MKPTIPAGSVVFTQKFPAYFNNDVIAFKNGNVTVTHRIVNIETKDNNIFYKTQGDANNTPDDKLINNDQISGKAFYHIPYLGEFIVFLKTLPGFLIFIVFPALIYIIFEIINIKKEMTKEIENKLRKEMQSL